MGCSLPILSLLNGNADSRRTSKQLPLWRTVVRGVDDVFSNMELLSGSRGASVGLEAICLAIQMESTSGYDAMDRLGWFFHDVESMLKSQMCHQKLLGGPSFSQVGVDH